MEPFLKKEEEADIWACDGVHEFHLLTSHQVKGNEV